MPMLPRGCDAYSVSRACASANQAITDAADQIVLGHRDVVIAGGAESLSNVPILHSRSMSDKLVALSRAKNARRNASRLLGSIRPRDLVPITPAIAEPSTGETMGQSAEKMAKINHISREEQDQFALRSHRLAAAGTEDGRLTAEIVPVLRAAAHTRQCSSERQRHSHRHVDRAASRAQAGVRSTVRQRDGGQLVAAHRRRERGAADERRARRDARLSRRSRTSVRTPTRRSIRASSC